MVRIPEASVAVGVIVAFALALLVFVKTLKTRLLLTNVPGHAMVGFVVSVTVTAKLQEANNPVLSVALHVTVVAPKGKILPLEALQAEDWMPIMSVGLTENLTTLLGAPPEVTLVADAGQPALGGVLSVTLTVKLHVLVRLALSLAVQPTIVGVVIRKNDPEVMLHTGLP
jgi:hypothetical protein